MRSLSGALTQWLYTGRYTSLQLPFNIMNHMEVQFKLEGTQPTRSRSMLHDSCLLMTLLSSVMRSLYASSLEAIQVLTCLVEEAK